MIGYDPKEYAQYHLASVKILQEKNAEIERLTAENERLTAELAAVRGELAECRQAAFENGRETERAAGYGELGY